MINIVDFALAVFEVDQHLHHGQDIFLTQCAKLIFGLLIIGVGVKAALVPLHGWLPQAMVAPAPVSALLHAVAVVKAGAFGIVRIVLDVYGIDNALRLGLLPPLTIAAAIMNITLATISRSNPATSLSHGPDQRPWMAIKAAWDMTVNGAMRQNVRLEKT